MNKITLGFFLAKSKTTIKGLLALFVFLLMNTQTNFAATYYSQGNLAPNLVVSWNTNRLGGGTSPTVFTAGDIFIIQGTGNGGTSPHSMTTSAVWSVSGASSKVWIENGGILTATFAVTLASATTFQIDNGGKYVHSNTGTFATTIFQGIESFSANSTVEFVDWATTGPSVATFGNLRMNPTGQPASALQLGGNTTTINGNLEVLASGTTTVRDLRLSSTTALNLIIAGDLIVSGTGSLDIASSAGSSVARIVNIGGSYNQTGGAVKCSGTSNPATINFTGVGKTFTQSAGTLINTNINWAINNGASLTLNSAFTVAASRTLTVTGTLENTATLTNSGTTTINGSFQLNQGGSATGTNFMYGSLGALIFNNTSGSIAVGSDVYWPTTSGPFNVNVLGTGGVTINAAKTVLNDLSISSAAVVLNADVTVNNNAAVNSGSLTVSAGKNLTVKNNLINNAAATAVVVENNANLIQGTATTVNANTGAITVNRNSNSLYHLDYTMWSSPVASQNLLAFSPLTSVIVSPPSSRFYNYDSTTNLYSTITDPANATFATGTGYLIRMPNEDPANLGAGSAYYLGTSALTYNGVFTGTPNNGDVTLPVTSGTYNAVGNPYPSTISADLFMSGNGITSNSDALYFWRKSNNSLATSYATYTTAGGTVNSGDPLAILPNGTIQVGQGFIAKSTSATLKFTNSMRTTNNSNQILKTKLIERNRIWLNLSYETTPINQMMVAYMTGATQGIDSAIDGSYINDSQTALNSLISNEEFVIQGRSLPFDGTDIVPLAFKTTSAGNFTIAIDHADGLFATGQDVYLVDSKTGAETNLKTSAYAFTATAGVDNARFSLKYQKTLKVDAPVFNDNTVSVYKNNGTLYVNSGAVAIANIKVFDIQGRLIAEQKGVKSNTATISNLKATQQVLIVQVTSEDKKVVNKKVVN